MNNYTYTLVDSNASPLSGYLIEVRSKSKEWTKTATTASDGTWTLSIDKFASDSFTLSIFTPNGSELKFSKEFQNLKMDAMTGAFDAQITAQGWTYEYALHDHNQNPVQGYQITLTDDNKVVYANAITDASGVWGLANPSWKQTNLTFTVYDDSSPRHVVHSQRFTDIIADTYLEGLFDYTLPPSGNKHASNHVFTVTDKFGVPWVGVNVAVITTDANSETNLVASTIAPTDSGGQWFLPKNEEFSNKNVQVVLSKNGTELGRSSLILGISSTQIRDGVFDAVLPRSAEQNYAPKSAPATIATVYSANSVAELQNLTSRNFAAVARETGLTPNAVREAVQVNAAFKQLGEPSQALDQLATLPANGIEFSQMITPDPDSTGLLALIEASLLVEGEVAPDMTALSDALTQARTGQVGTQGTTSYLSMSALGTPGDAEFETHRTQLANAGTSSAAYWSSVANAWTQPTDGTSGEQRAVLLQTLQQLFPTQAAIDEAEAQLSGDPPSSLLDSVPKIQAIAGALRPPGEAATAFPDPYDRMVWRSLQSFFPTAALRFAVEDTGQTSAQVSDKPLWFPRAQSPSFPDNALSASLVGALNAADVWDIDQLSASIDPGVSTLKRLAGLAPAAFRVEAIFALAARGYTGSADVLKKSLDEFVEDIETSTLNADDAEVIYRRAESRQAASLNLWVAFATSTGRHMPGALSSQAVDNPDSGTNASVGEILVGSNQCDCEPGTSVLSPGAYLADLCSWLDQKGLFDELAGDGQPNTGRRPDLRNLVLDSENTFVPVATLQRVVEVLDERIGGTPAVDELVSATTVDALASTTTVRTTPKTSLPVHLPTSEARHWAREGQLNVHALAEKLGISIGSRACYLGLTPALYTDLATTAGDGADWGYSAVDWPSTLAQLPELLQRTNWDLEQLKEFTNSFLGETVGIHPSPSAPAGSCDPTEWVVAADAQSTEVPAQVAADLLFLLRTSHVFGETWQDMDLAVHAVRKTYVGATQAQVVDDLVDLWSVADQLGVHARKLVPLLGTMDTRRMNGPSSYDVLFAGSSLAIENGAAEYVPSAASPSGDVEGAIARLIELFAIDESSIAWIENAAGGSSSTLKTLARVQLVTTLAEALEESVADVVFLLGLTDVPFWSATGAASRISSFSHVVDQLIQHKQSPWQTSDLPGLLALAEDATGESWFGVQGKIAIVEQMSHIWSDLEAFFAEKTTAPSFITSSTDMPFTWSDYMYWRSFVDVVQAAMAHNAQPLSTVLEDIEVGSTNTAGNLGLAADAALGPGEPSTGFQDRVTFWSNALRVSKIIDTAMLRGWILDFGSSLGEVSTWTLDHVPNASRAQAIERVSEGFLERTRDALVDHLLGTNATMNTHQDIVADLLVDVFATGCSTTTRVLEATLAVQQFVNQKLRDSTSPLTAQDATTWRWLKTFRVWEASRKVFLWPENWMRPELRRIKTPEFERFQQAVLSGGLEEHELAAAYRELVRGVEQVSAARVVAITTDTSGVVPVTHLLMRIPGNEGTLYHRSWTGYRTFGPVRPLPFSVSAQHLLPVASNGRLQVFWTEFLEEANTSPSTDSFEPTDHWWNVQLFQSEFSFSGWSSPMVVSEPLTLKSTSSRNSYVGKLPKDQYYLVYEASPTPIVSLHCVYTVEAQQDDVGPGPTGGGSVGFIPAKPDFEFERFIYEDPFDDGDGSFGEDEQPVTNGNTLFESISSTN